MDWTVHWLEAEGELAPWRERIAAEIEAAREAMAHVLPLTRLDVLVDRNGEVIPETGTAGCAYRKSLFSLTVDPLNPNFPKRLADGDLRRTAAHEAHHCMRMGGPGYGRTLGEALVSEGLAGNFVSRLFASPPDPWECAVGADVLAAHRPDAEALASSDYDHTSWFYGSDGRRPRWLGYTLGYAIVRDWLVENPSVAGTTWVDVPATTVLAGLPSEPR